MNEKGMKLLIVALDFQDKYGFFGIVYSCALQNFQINKMIGCSFVEEYWGHRAAIIACGKATIDEQHKLLVRWVIQISVRSQPEIAITSNGFVGVHKNKRWKDQPNGIYSVKSAYYFTSSAHTKFKGWERRRPLLMLVLPNLKVHSLLIEVAYNLFVGRN